MAGRVAPRVQGWSPSRFAWRSAAGHRRGQTLALVTVSALLTACVAFAPVYDRAMQQALVDTLLERASTSQRVVAVTSESAVNAIGTTQARDPRELQATVPREMSARLGPAVLGRTALVTPAAGDVAPTGQLVWRDGGCEHVRLVSGSCPSASGDILVSETDVETFGLSTGATLPVSPAEDGPDVVLTVVGTYAVDGSPSDTAWWQGLTLVGHSRVTHGTDPSASHDAWLTSEATFDDANVLAAEISSWSAVVPTVTTGVDELYALGERVRELGREVRGQGKDLHVVSILDEVAAQVDAQTRQAHRTVPLLMAPMAVLSLLALWLVLSAAIDQRRREVAVARLRGWGPLGAVGLLLVELLPVVLSGVVPGVGLALLGGTVARALLPGSAPFEAGPGFGTAVLVVVLVLVVATAGSAVRGAREPLGTLVSNGRVRSRRWAVGALDAFLLAAVGTGALAFVAGGLSGTFALAGPALLALSVGLLLAQLGAPGAAVTGRRLLNGGRLVAGLTLLDLGRRRETRTVIAAITVASALAVFSIDALLIGERNRVNASQHDAGAPVVLGVDSNDVDAVRAAVGAADPSGRRATTVLVAEDTLAVEPEVFRHVAFFPRGAPTASEWDAIAPPRHAPVTLTGARVALTVRPAAGFAAKDILGADSEVRLGLAVTTATGVRRTIALGPLPPAGETAVLVGNGRTCVGGCRLAAVQLTAAQGVTVDGLLDLSDLRVDRGPVRWSTSPERWNTTEGERAVIRPLAGASGRALRVQVSIRGTYPAELTPAWVPSPVPALLTTAPEDPAALVVTGVDGSDRPAVAAGHLTLVPAMPRRSALVDLDAVSRGAAITFDAHTEVWLTADPDLADAVRGQLHERGIAVTGRRTLTTIRESYDDTVAAWSLVLGAVTGPAVVLVALLVLLALAVIGWRARARDLAIIRLHGAGRRTIGRLAVWAQLPAVLVAVLAGIAAGLGGAVLAMPDVELYPAAPEVPVVDTSTSWPAVLAAAATCLLVMPAAAALAGRAIARRAHLERVEEGT